MNSPEAACADFRAVLQFLQIFLANPIQYGYICGAECIAVDFLWSNPLDVVVFEHLWRTCGNACMEQCQMHGEIGI